MALNTRTLTFFSYCISLGALKGLCNSTCCQTILFYIRHNLISLMNDRKSLPLILPFGPLLTTIFLHVSLRGPRILLISDLSRGQSYHASIGFSLSFLLCLEIARFMHTVPSYPALDSGYMHVCRSLGSINPYVGKLSV